MNWTRLKSRHAFWIGHALNRFLTAYSLESRPASWVGHALDHFLTAYKSPSKVFDPPQLIEMDFGIFWTKIEAIIFIVCVVALVGPRLAWRDTLESELRATHLCLSFVCQRCIVNLAIYGVDSVNEFV